MAVASGSIKSTLNPNAPLFVPAAFQQVEDFSPEWWELVKTTTWFRDYWFHEHQEQETFNGYYDEDDDIANLLPESFDLGIVDDFLDSHPHPDEEERFHQQSEADRRATAMSDDHKLLKSGKSHERHPATQK
ncbi:unnamed protein product [Spirodela intermedia]|uniref:Uncharacterized protein n=1 Tax=Spirodela intermedia TaxID=51605 RepID=A0A7I8L798_SPIIN|nr:unnamed protein product [Spirodela intermedia]